MPDKSSSSSTRGKGKKKTTTKGGNKKKQLKISIEKEEEEEEEEDCDCIYDLHSLVSHKGNINSGHYVSYVKHFDKWFKMDDSLITNASEQEVMEAQAYLLFYHRRSK